ncbi:hypothetical protein [Microbacterium sp. H1-D42]|uniref:hypothetical protein n=1 Tax=Microbacterium sp. H1-D42 TaxID=2925844 RepID=UPI001F52E6EA|nr:hypothetical protein [Microbacterium sp. H1-D42]UNK69665.1 hypothetical protein MNR00_10805 [Microbacterium sp. H1-D42]
MRPRTLALWAAFIVAHALVTWLGWVLPNHPMGDVVLVYEPWSAAALSGGGVMGITAAWVYPQLALVPMLLTQLLAAPLTPALGADNAYLIGWAVLITIGDLLAFAVLVGRGQVRRRRLAGWFWIGALVLLGPIALYRIDAVTVPLAIVGGLWLARRPVAGTVLLTLGAWVKIWPGAIVLAAIAAGRRSPRVALIAASVSAGLIAVFFLLGADRELFGFLTTQGGRGLQIEAVAATPFLWMAASGTAVIDYSIEILTFQIRAPGADLVSIWLTPLMVAMVAGILVLGVWRAQAGAAWHRLLPPLSMAFVAALIVSNKVGSPQFQTWLIAPVILWIVFDRARAHAAAAMVLMLCALTLAVYPLTYDGLLHAHLLPVVLITARNLLLIVLLVHAIRAVVRVPASAARPH